MTNIPQKTCIKVKGLTLFTLLRVKEVKVLTLPHVSPFTLVDPRLSESDNAYSTFHEKASKLED